MSMQLKTSCRRLLPALALALIASSAAPAFAARTYPLHTNIVSTTFWVGEIFDPTAEDGSQMFSTYDSDWYASYGGCDGMISNTDDGQTCETERRVASNGYFPTRMQPRENPFYLDLPFDDLNDEIGFRTRCKVIPWAADPGYAGHCKDPNFSYMKNRWVKLIGPNGRTCYGQIQDAGPARYHDANYVFGAHNARPANRLYNGAGMDVSPGLNGCLGYRDLDGANDRVAWRFVEEADVPYGPWKRIITRSGVR